MRAPARGRDVPSEYAQAAGPEGVIDIFLQPGELYFGDRHTRIRTLLGSCVSLVFWHPRHRVGGMCHYMLPFRSPPRSGEELDGRYADEAMELMFREMRAIGTHPLEYVVKVFGGANMFPDEPCRGLCDVGQRNAQTAYRMLEIQGLSCVSSHTAGTGHRTVMFDVWSGNVWVRHQPLLRGDGMALCVGISH